MNFLDLNGSRMSASTSMDDSSLSFAKTATIQTGEEILEQELFIEHDDVGIIDFVDQDIEKFQVGKEEIVSISEGVGSGSSPGKLKGQKIHHRMQNIPSRGC